MIEVEKKFIFNAEDQGRVLKDAEFIKEIVFTDIYYDTDQFTLTLQDKWLRSRNGSFELKISHVHQGSRLADQYEEIEDEKEVFRLLNLSVTSSLKEELEKNGYKAFCCAQTTRKKYKKGEFIIDLDMVDFKDFIYAIGEIELMVHDKSEINDAIEKIMGFAKEEHLAFTPVRGKVVEYLKRVNPAHYQALIQAKIITDF